MQLARATPQDFGQILAAQGEFWGDRDLRDRHHPMYLHEFGDTALVLRDPDGTVQGYLFGFVAPTRVGYVHLVGVRESHRRRGLGRLLYAEFSRLAAERGAESLKAITTPSNALSIAFHTGLGMHAELAPGYGGPGEDRVIFVGELV